MNLFDTYDYDDELEMIVGHLDDDDVELLTMDDEIIEHMFNMLMDGTGEGQVL